MNLDLLLKQMDFLKTFDFGVCVIDKNLTVKHWNYWLENITFLKNENILHKKIDDIFPQLDKKLLEKYVHNTLNINSPITYTSEKDYLFPIKNNQSDSSVYEYMSQVVTLYKIDSNYILITIADQTKQIQKVRKSIEESIFLEHQKELRIDKLTGLPNRLELLERLSVDSHKMLALINISDFKTINNFYGYEIGDKYLIDVAQKIIKFTDRLKLELYKLPSDEYVVYKANQQSYTSEQFQEDILAIISTVEYENYEDSENKIPIFFDVGISIEDDNIFKKADIALKESKKTKKHFIIYNESLSIDSTVQERIKWLHILRDAIDKKRVYPFFQPIYNLHSGKIEKYESLIRLIDADGKVISPFFFLGVAKQAKLYHELTNIVIRHAFETFKDTEYEFSINMSIEDIMYEPSIKLLKELLANNPNTAKRLVIELLEDEGIENFDLVNDFIHDIRKYDVKIAIDDFGTGYSNFSYLLQLNVDYLKIDASLIKNVDTDPNSQKIVETLVDFGSKINVKIIAEFVSKESIFNKIKELSIDYAQGYYIDQPRKEIGGEPRWKE